MGIDLDAPLTLADLANALGALLVALFTWALLRLERMRSRAGFQLREAWQDIQFLSIGPEHRHQGVLSFYMVNRGGLDSDIDLQRCYLLLAPEDGKTERWVKPNQDQHREARGRRVSRIKAAWLRRRGWKRIAVQPITRRQARGLALTPPFALKAAQAPAEPDEPDEPEPFTLPANRAKRFFATFDRPDTIQGSRRAVLVIHPIVGPATRIRLNIR